MNNRNANVQHKYENLTKWCEEYHKDSGIKVHPSSVPVDLVLEDLMGHAINQKKLLEIITDNIVHITKRFEFIAKQFEDVFENIEAIKARHDITFDRLHNLEKRVDDIPEKDTKKVRK